MTSNAGRRVIWPLRASCAPSSASYLIEFPCRITPSWLDPSETLRVLPPLIHVDSGGRVLHCCEGLVGETK
jgi:hypothetical protein